MQLENRKQNSLRKLKAEKTKRKKPRWQWICQSDSETNESKENICKLVESDDEDDVVSSASSINENLIEVDNFVIVRFEGKRAPHFYVGYIKEVDEDECSTKLMRQGNRSEKFIDSSTFYFKENDCCTFSRNKNVKKLSVPLKFGGTVRREKIFIFACDLSKWAVE